MYITGLEASGLKGLTFSHELQRCVLFTGKNFVGKSARLEAIRLALQAHVASLGKQNQATWELSSGGTLFSKVLFDDGTDANVSFKAEGESVTMARRWEPEWLKNASMPMLNPEEYFNLTDSERIQYVFGMMKMPDTFTVDGILADLRNLTLEENTEHTERAKGLIALEVGTELRNAATLSGGLTELTKDKGMLKQQFAYWNKRAKDTQGTLRVLSELKTRGAEATAETIQGIAQQMSDVAAKLDAANHASGALTRQQMDANRVGIRRQQIETELARVPEAETNGDILELSIIEVDKKLKTKVKVFTKEQVDALEADWDNLVNAEHSAGIDESHLAEEVEKVNQGAQALKAQVSCPHCKSKSKDWKKNLAADYANQLAELTPKLATIVKQRAELKAKVAKAKGLWDKARTAYEARQTLLNERAGYQQSLEALNARTAGAQARRQALREEFESLEATPAVSTEAMDAAAANVMKLRTEHQTLSDRHTRLVQLQQDLIRAGEAAEEHQVAAAKVAVIKAVGALLKERQSSMIAVLFGDLMKVANYFTQGIMEHALVFQAGRIGYVKNGRFVSHKTFSGTEKALTYIAITAALMRDAPLRIPLLDEFDIDKDVFPKILNRLEQAVKDGVIDQVIVAHTERPKLLSGGWQHIPLTAAA